MKSFLTSLTSVALKRPLTMALLCGLLVAGLGLGVSRLQFDNRPDAFFLKDDPTVETWRDFKQLYASDEFSVVVLTPPEVALDFIRELRDLTFDLETLDGVTRVTSLINVRSIRDDDGDLDVGEYLRQDLPAEEQLARLADAATHPHYSGLYLNEDATAFAILIETAPDFTTQDKFRFTREVRARIETLPFAAYGIGAPVLDTDVQTIVGSESGLFGALTFAMVLAGFALAYRSWVGLALPLAVSVGSVVGSLGIMGHLGAAAGILTPIVPSFLISVGLGASVYLLTPFHRALRDGGSRREAVRHAVSEAGPAALVAGLTTVVALFAFSGSRVLPVREVGLTLGIGLLIALVLTFLLFPVLASRLPVRRIKPSAEVRPGRDRITALLTALARNSIERPRRMVAGFCVLIVFALIGVAQLRTDYDYLGTFKASTRIVQDYRAANGEIPVSNSIELVVHTGQTDAFKRPDALRALDRLAENALRFATDDLPLKSYSLADVVKELAQETQGAYAIPDEQNTVSQLLFLFESSGHDELSRLTNFDFDQARITLLVPTRPYGEYTPIIDSLQANAPAIFAQHGLEGAELVITGVVPLWMQLSGFLTETQIQSFVYAALAVAMIMMLIFRSIRLGLVMAGLNIGCVVLVLGAMGWAGIALDPFTILVGAIALGILDDDTIHFVRSALSRLESGEGLSPAIHATFQSTGRAIGLQTIVLVIAFVVYLFSSVASLSLFGALTATAILIALAVEFFVTPALLVLVLRRQHPVKRLS